MNDIKKDAGIIERIKLIIKHLQLNQSQFARECNIQPSNISAILNGKRACDQAIINKIVLSFDIDKDWLETGEGEMLKTAPAINDPEEKESEEEEKFYTYKLPIAAVGGSLDGWGPQNPIMPWECERVVSPVRGVDLAVPVVGDSMSPDYPNGSTVYVKKINPDYFINWGQVFVLDTENGSILKEVQPCEDDECIECHSLNPNGKYKPFKVPKNTIRGMYRVVACVSLR